MSNATQLIHSIPSDPLTGAISVPICRPKSLIRLSVGIENAKDLIEN